MLLARRWHLGKLLLFVALSGADYALTWHLIHKTDGVVYESNPVAAWWIGQWGWLGLAVFKAAQVVVVAGLALAIARYRPRLGGGVLAGACVAVACVVAYSVHLGGYLNGDSDEPTVRDLIAMTEESDQLAVEVESLREYRVILGSVTSRLAAGEMSLPDAVDVVMGTARCRDAKWMAKLRRAFPDHTDQECVASNLVAHALGSLQNEREKALRRQSQFEREFRTAFGNELPKDRIFSVVSVPAQSDEAITESVAESATHGEY